MKTKATRLAVVVFLCMTVATFNSKAQGFLNDSAAYAPSAAKHFFENRGQLLNTAGDSIPDIKYYLEKGPQKIFFGTEGVHYVNLKPATRPPYEGLDSLTALDSLTLPYPDTVAYVDSVVRLDLAYNCDAATSANCGTLSALDSAAEHLNYYLPHCGSGGIEGITGYEKVKYTSAFDGVDVYWTSNADGMITYYQVAPHAEPGNIRLLFSGQDSLGLLPNGDLVAMIGNQQILVPHLRAYEYDATNAVTQLSWTPDYSINTDGSVTLNIGPYDVNQTLVFTDVFQAPARATASNVGWATYYDDKGGSNGNKICTEKYGYTDPSSTPNGNIAVYTAQVGDPVSFPQYRGYSYSSSASPNSAVCFTRFDGGSVRIWSSYYGGPTGSRVTGLTTGPNGLYFTGFAYQAATYNLNSSYFYNTQGNGLIGQFDKVYGKALWITHVDGEAYSGGSFPVFTNALSIYDGKLYVAGSAGGNVKVSNYPNATGTFPLQSISPYTRYFYPTVSYAVGVGTAIGAFVMEFDLVHNSLIWSTFVGSKVDLTAICKTNNFLYIGGATQKLHDGVSYTSPRTAPASDGIVPLVNANGSSAYLQTAQTAETSSDQDDGYIGAFDASYQLIWSTYFGGKKNDIVSSIAANDLGDLWVTGSTATTTSTPGGAYPNAASNARGEFPTYKAARIPVAPPFIYVYPFYQGTYAGGNSDDFIARFDNSMGLKWCSYFGGPCDEGQPRMLGSLNDFAPAPALSTDGAYKNVVLAGTTQKWTTASSTLSIPIVSATGLYSQPNNASSAEALKGLDAYFGLFNNDNSLKWAQHYGGNGVNPLDNSANRADEQLRGVAMGPNYRIYSVLSSRSNTTPVTCPPNTTGPPYCDLTYAGGTDVVVGYLPYAPISNTAVTPPRLARPEPGLQVQTYPNPAYDGATVSYIAQQEGTTALTLRNNTGQTVVSVTLHAMPGNNSCYVSLDGLAAGMYFLTLSNNEGHETAKIIKR